MPRLVPPGTTTLTTANGTIQIKPRAFDPRILGYQYGVTPPDIVRYNQSSGFNQLTYTRPNAPAYRSFTKRVAIYIDGACTNNGFAGASAGVGVYVAPDSAWNESLPLPSRYGTHTNQKAEIYAAILACDVICDMIGPTTYNAVLITDSDYLFHAMTDWIHTWRQNGYRAANGRIVENGALFRELDAKWSHLEDELAIDLEIWKVDRRFNRDADRLARDGISAVAELGLVEVV